MLVVGGLQLCSERMLLEQAAANLQVSAFGTE
jgi:hypothetical protein